MKSPNNDPEKHRIAELLKLRLQGKLTQDELETAIRKKYTIAQALGEVEPDDDLPF